MRCSSPHWRCDLMMKLPPQVNTAFEMLEAAGYEAYLVGGAVRDYVRDNSPRRIGTSPPTRSQSRWRRSLQATT